MALRENDELLEFRAQWKEEIETKTIKEVKTKVEQSLDLFRQALYYEREGQPFEAVRYYRQAFRLNPELEHSRQAQLDADFLGLEGQNQQPENHQQQNFKISHNLAPVSY